MKKANVVRRMKAKIALGALAITLMLGTAGTALADSNRKNGGLAARHAGAAHGPESGAWRLPD